MKKILFYLLSKIESITGYFISISLHPKCFDTSPSVDDLVHSEKKIAIVMQGPIKIEDDFTLETLRLYSKIFPYAIIILSTWKDQEINVINQVKNLGIKVILNEYPKYNGNINVNYQITSTINGIIEAKRVGATHCLKTRTDQRLHRSTTLNFLLSVLDTFVLPDYCENQLERIISLNYSTSTRELYWLGDFFMFGNISDMEKYWGVELQDENYKGLLDDPDYVECNKNFSGIVPEMYLTVSYLKSIEIDLEWTKKGWWNILRDRFCIVDENMIDLYWYKYLSRFRANSLESYSSIDSYSYINYSRWLTVVSDKEWEKKVL